MNPRRLAFLRLVIETGGFAAAAEAAGVSQPAISQAMRTLARELGCALFERTGRRQVPTVQALAVARAGLDVHGAIEQVRYEAQQGPAASAELRVGMSPAMGLQHGALLYERLRVADPACVLRIGTAPAPRMLRALIAGELDLVAAPRPRGFEHAEVRHQRLFTSQPAIHARQGHALARTRRLAELATASWVVAGDAGTPGNLVEEAFRVRGWPAPRIAVHCADYAMLVELAAASDLLCVIPSPTLLLGGHGPGLRRIEVVERLPHYDMCLFQRRSADIRRTDLCAVLADALIAATRERRTEAEPVS